MKEESDMENKKRRKADRGKATMLGWTIGEMSTEIKFIYGVLVIGIIGAVFWFLYKKVATEKQIPAKKDKSKKKK